MNCELMFLKVFSKLSKKSRRSFEIEFLLRKLQVYKLQASAFRVYKILENSWYKSGVPLEFLFTEAGATGTILSNSCSKQLNGKLPGRPASVVKMDFTWMFYWKVFRISVTPFYIRTNFIITTRLKLVKK